VPDNRYWLCWSFRLGTIARFTEELSKQGIPVLGYSADELEKELKTIG